jgi:hypothetical protein
MQRDKEDSINIYMVLLALLALSTTVQGRFLFSVSHIGCKKKAVKEGRKEGSNQASQLCVPNPCRVFFVVCGLSFFLAPIVKTGSSSSTAENPPSKETQSSRMSLLSPSLQGNIHT